MAGLCRVATLAEIEAQGWSLNPGRYIGVAERAADEFEFTVRLEELHEEEELETLNSEARELEDLIAENVRYFTKCKNVIIRALGSEETVEPDLGDLIAHSPDQMQSLLGSVRIEIRVKPLLEQSLRAAVDFLGTGVHQ